MSFERISRRFMVHCERPENVKGSKVNRMKIEPFRVHGATALLSSNHLFLWLTCQQNCRWCGQCHVKWSTSHKITSFLREGTAPWENTQISLATLLLPSELRLFMTLWPQIQSNENGSSLVLIKLLKAPVCGQWICNNKDSLLHGAHARTQKRLNLVNAELKRLCHGLKCLYLFSYSEAYHERMAQLNGSLDIAPFNAQT